MVEIVNPKNVIQSFDYEKVNLLDGLLKNQFKQVRDFYYGISNDNILKEFRSKAGLPSPGKHLGGWYSKNQSAFGQWLSAFARMYKVTGDTAMRDKAVYLMDEWAKTISEEEWSRSMSHYVYDKIVCGLVDIYKYIKDKNALQHLDRITKWAEKNLDRSRPYAGGGEWYTLSENLYRAYEVSGEKHYFNFAKVWEYIKFWECFAQKEDIFVALKTSQNKHYHAYSHVNTLSGAAMAYKVSGEHHYLDTIVNAYNFLQDTQCFATGGYGPRENLVEPNGLAETLKDISSIGRFHFETACGSWAGFKLARYLITFTGEAEYGDWIERLVYNGVGALIPVNDYGLIMYGSQYNLYGGQKSLWMEWPWSCCTGTLPQAVTDYHNLIYFYDAENLYINLYVPSEVKWSGPNGSVTVVQETRYPEQDTVLIRVQQERSGRFGLKFRVPRWANNKVTIKVNNIVYKTETVSGKWATIDRKWRSDDTVLLQFDLSPRLEPVTGFVSPVAVVCGPVVMASITYLCELPADKDMKHPSNWLKWSNGKFELTSPPQSLGHEFKPFYKLKEGEAYRMYFKRPDEVSISTDEIVFYGNWFSDNIIKYAEKPGSYFEAKFKGTTLVWEGLRQDDAGIAEVSIDGKKVVEVDQYGYTEIFDHTIGIYQYRVPFFWSISGLDKHEHSVRVTILPHKNPASGGTKLNVQRLVVFP